MFIQTLRSILAGIGILNAGFLILLARIGADSCGLGSCASVLGDTFSKLGPVPVAVIGLFYFVYIFVLFWPQNQPAHRKDRAIVAAVLTACAAPLVLFYLVRMFWVIGELCGFCLISHVLFFILAGFVYIEWNSQGRPKFEFGNMIQYGRYEGLSFLITMGVWALLSWGIYGVFSQQGMIAADRVVGKMDGHEIILAEVDEEISGQIRQLDTQKYKLRQQVLDYWVLGEAAKEENMSAEDLLNKQLSTISISQAEISEAIAEQKALNPGKIVENKKVEYALLMRKRHQVAVEFLQSLKDDLKFQEYLPRPASVKVKENPYFRAVKGPDSAPIKVAKFSDLECPSCYRAHVSLKSLMEKYPGMIQLEYRHMPLPSHKMAGPAALATICAGQQGQFFEYLDAAFKDRKNFSESQFFTIARRVNLDQAAFKTCMADPGKAEEALRFDISEAKRLGLSRTPSLIVDGEVLEGYPGDQWFLQKAATLSQ